MFVFKKKKVVYYFIGFAVFIGVGSWMFNKVQTRISLENIKNSANLTGGQKQADSIVATLLPLLENSWYNPMDYSEKVGRELRYSKKVGLWDILHTRWFLHTNKRLYNSMWSDDLKSEYISAKNS